MKTLKFFLALCILFSATVLAKGQQEIRWMGGHPGEECNWNQAENWNLQRVPTSEDLAVIPNLNAVNGCYPIITTSLQNIFGLYIEEGAYLNISFTGQLQVDGGQALTNGIQLEGQLNNQGKITIVNPAFEPISGKLDRLQNSGDIYLVDTEKEIRFRYQPGMDISQLLSQQ